MIDFILDVSLNARKKIIKNPDWVSEVADISAEHGGPLFYWKKQKGKLKKRGHASHQSGLDADIGYMIRNKESGYYGRSVVSGNRLTTEFLAEEQYEWFKTMTSMYQGKALYCIFVHRIIKREMCRIAKQKGEYDDKLTREMLRRLQIRPSDHHDHFHLRLKCPPNNKGCYQANDFENKTGC
jgi:penicillin-insensitive murein endopeptidase